MKKKFSATKKDKEDWSAFTKNPGNILNKDVKETFNNNKLGKIRKLDLHGLSLEQANYKVKKFIIESSKIGYKKLLIVTGKGLRPKVDKNPYISKEMSVLKHSVPDFIQQNEDLSNLISKIETASLKDGGEGAFYIYLKK